MTTQPLIQPLIEDTGPRPAATGHDRDPFEQLDDLMSVVEALCPVWPDRDTFEKSKIFLL